LAALSKSAKSYVTHFGLLAILVQSTNTDAPLLFKALAALSKSAKSYVTHFTKLVLSRVDVSKEKSFCQDEEKFLRELEVRR
jgi:hypothetical protein